jgi:hypothetical protein
MAYGSSHFFAGCDLAFSRSQPAPTFGDHGAVITHGLKGETAQATTCCITISDTAAS